MSFFGNRRQAETAPPPTIEKPTQLPRPTMPPAPVGFETVLGANCTLEGTLRSNANVRLDGTFTGTLEINGNVLVGETAKITADINARNISIAGAVKGNVSGKKVQLLRTGRIWGDIRATALTTEEGAFIDGKITMVSQETAANAVEPSVTEVHPVTPAPVASPVEDNKSDETEDAPLADSAAVNDLHSESEPSSPDAEDHVN